MRQSFPQRIAWVYAWQSCTLQHAPIRIDFETIAYLSEHTRGHNRLRYRKVPIFGETSTIDTLFAVEADLQLPNEIAGAEETKLVKRVAVDIPTSHLHRESDRRRVAPLAP